MLLPHPTACFENNRHDSINAGMPLLTITIAMANALHMADFKFYKSFFLYGLCLKTFWYSNSVHERDFIQVKNANDKQIKYSCFGYKVLRVVTI